MNSKIETIVIVMLNISIVMSGVIIAILITQTNATVLERHKAEFEIVEIDPPKHYHLKLRNTKTNNITSHWISKHCLTWRKVKIGTIFEASVITTRYTNPLRTPKTITRVHIPQHISCPQ